MKDGNLGGKRDGGDFESFQREFSPPFPVSNAIDDTQRHRNFSTGLKASLRSSGVKVFTGNEFR